MGSFIGHAIPGIFFMVFGSWWTIQIYRRYFKSVKKTTQPFRCQVTYFPTCGGCRFDLEAAFMVLVNVLGILVELVFAHIRFGTPPGMNNIQHATMYFFFGLFGVLCLLKPLLQKFIPNIEDIAYVSFAMAYTVEAILFKFHLMERDMLDTTLHTLLLYSIYGCIIMTLGEMNFRHQVLATLGRAYFTILQGTWFCQVGFILYKTSEISHTSNPSWDHEDHNHIMYATCIFTWHIGGVFLLMLLCGFGLACVCWRRGELNVYEKLKVKQFQDECKELISDDEDYKATPVNILKKSLVIREDADLSD